MKGIFITSENCSPCDKMKGDLSGLIASGEIVEKNYEAEEADVLELMQKYDAGIPSLLIFSDSGEFILST